MEIRSSTLQYLCDNENKFTQMASDIWSHPQIALQETYAAKIIAEKKANEPKPIETYFKPAPVSQAPVFVYKPVPVAPKPAPVVVRPAPVYFAPKPAPVVVPVIKPQILPAALPQQSVYNPMPLPSWATF